jgi:F-type H+-transporting ATPase subunit b
MAQKKNKKRVLLIFLSAYLVFSIAFAMFYSQNRKLVDSPDMKSVATERRANIHETAGRVEKELKEVVKLDDKQVDQIYQVIYGVSATAGSEQEKVVEARKAALRKGFDKEKGFVSYESAKEIYNVLYGPKNDDPDKEKKIGQIQAFAQSVGTTPSKEQMEEMYGIIYGPKLEPIAVNFTMIMQIINFAAFMTLMYLLLWGPLTKFLDERRKKIQDDIDAAKNKNAEAEKMLQDYKQKLHNTRDDVARMMEEGRKQTEAKAQEIMEDARREVERLKERARVEMEGVVAATRRQLRGEFAAVSIGIAEKILEREITDKDHLALVDQAMRGLENEGVKFE